MSHTNLWYIGAGGQTGTFNTGSDMGQEGMADNYTHVETSFGTEGMESVRAACPTLSTIIFVCKWQPRECQTLFSPAPRHLLSTL